jgi:RNA polymerase primary sigma factor
MATKAATAAESTETREEAAEGPLLDAIAATIKKMVARGKERGYVTWDELNAALPQDQVSAEQIEDTMTMLSELGVNVIESEACQSQQALRGRGSGTAQLELLIRQRVTNRLGSRRRWKASA